MVSRRIIFRLLQCITGTLALTLILLCHVSYDKVTMSRLRLERIRNASRQLYTSARCRPAEHIIFIKVHKAGSSTVFNILMRYASQNLLNVAMPHQADAFHLGLPWHFTPEVVQKFSAANMTTNLVTMHLRYKHSALRELMPEAQPKFITIMRKPADMFASMYHYYQLDKHFNATLEKFVVTAVLTEELRHNRYSSVLGFNQIAFDLGMENFDNSAAVDELIRHVNKTFHLVMIAERLEESLILLRNKLCLPFTSILAFRKNALSKRAQLSNATRWGLKKLNHIDMQLYTFFSDKLDREVNKFGRKRMEKYVGQLQNATRYWYSRCVNHEADVRVIVQVVKPERRDEELCRWLTYDELKFAREVRDIQARRARMATGRFYS
ncbi:galactosylceramide sulfotransferase-like [Ornithodoros turicata]|uniref:galactosylceramide sulfotransferase-like n=1 Tax=Ornithodoros turicata TaxID=34597 RepID=UPI003139A438